MKRNLLKRNLLVSYLGGIRDRDHGEGYSKIFYYFIPEFITAVILYSVPLLIDASWVAHLKSTSAYATLGVTNSLLHSIIKIAEGLSIGTIVVVGRYNGIGNYKKAGSALINSFWTTVFTGLFVGLLLYFGAYYIFVWYRVPEQMIVLGIPFLRMRSLGVFFTFVYFGLIGFLRGIKNTQVPMNIFIAGCILFLFFDYALIFGKFGFPKMGLMGSAIASVVEYGSMCIAAILYIFFSKSIRAYQINFFESFASYQKMKELFLLSLPVMIDKAALACSYVWLGYCIAPMGTNALASFSVIKDIERFSLLPAIAFAQVITFLVSNDYGKKDWEGIKSTTKKIIFMASVSVFFILFLCSISPKYIIQLFDLKGEFTDFAAKAFPVISVLAFFDILQLILAGALRGAADVRVVMWTRLVLCAGFFAPLAFGFSRLETQSVVIKFILVYSSLYVCNAIMSMVYVWRLRRESWKEKVLEGV